MQVQVQAQVQDPISDAGSDSNAGSGSKAGSGSDTGLGSVSATVLLCVQVQT